MPPNLEEYEAFIYDIPNRFPSVRYAVLNFIHLEPLAAVVKAELFFKCDISLRARQTLDFDGSFIQSYSYEVYKGEDKLYWYDSWPHPHHPELADTHPHHKHVPPDIKHNRIPSPELSLDRPNIPFIIREIEETLLGS